MITLASVGYGDISPVTPMGRVMTIILALLGIGIFAIPAALLSSAFSDQLRVDRETMKAELYEMMADGVIDDDELAKIHSEAKRLHISEDEVQRLIQKARQERESQDNTLTLPLHKIAASPEHAVEHYRILFAEIRQLGLMTDMKRFEEIADEEGRLTARELTVWRQIQGKRTAGVKKAA